MDTTFNDIREKLEKIVKHNQKMLAKGREDLVVTFLDESEGISVWNPFFDVTERFEVDPINEYSPVELYSMIDNYKKLRLKKWTQFIFN